MTALSQFNKYIVTCNLQPHIYSVFSFPTTSKNPPYLLTYLLTCLLLSKIYSKAFSFGSSVNKLYDPKKNGFFRPFCRFRSPSPSAA